MDPLFWVAVVSTVLSGFFALTGFALRRFRRAHAGQTHHDQTRRKRLQTLQTHLEPLRLTSSFARALANLVLVVSILYLMGGLSAGPIRVLVAIITASGVIAIFGIAIPHAWASYAGDKVLLTVAPVLMGVRWGLYPIVQAMRIFDVPIRRLSGSDNNDNENGENAKQEILQAASEGRAEGAVDPEEVEMIASVIEFADTCAGEIMTPRTDIFALPVSMQWKQAALKVFEAGRTRVPVYQDNLDGIIGILYAKDLLRYVDEPADFDLRQIMRKALFIPETKPLDDLLRQFKTQKVHLAVVLDEYGGTAGLVSIEDLLEEIVGDISDEYDQIEPALMKRIDERTAEVDGRMYIDDLNDAMKLDIPEEEDYDTVAGFVFSALGRIPEENETLQSHGATFTIISADERKITKLRVELGEAKGDS